MTYAEEKKYGVLNVRQAKEISHLYLEEIELQNVLSFGLPEIDDRYNIWRVPLMNSIGECIGEIVIDAKSSLIVESKTTKKDILEKRLLGRNGKPQKKQNKIGLKKYVLSSIRNTVAFGDSEEILELIPTESIDLIFTSPPYYNARPEYTDYISYEDYLLKIRKVLQRAHRVLSDGRFFVINVSPVLVRRANRNETSKRIAVPFDFHRLFVEEGYEFVDDIIWVKPEGAGWATGRGRRFAADRNPLQYKTVPVTEYVLVYRKKSDKLIDWYIRNFPDKKLLKESKIPDGYEKTNVWKIKPVHDKNHPAIFPLELAQKVIQYYSFKKDVVLDPFAGIGTVGEAAISLNRRFVLVDINMEYIETIKKRVQVWLNGKIEDIHWINTNRPKINPIQMKLIE
ncbi:MAG: site-specific DNA-methyltransferase [Nitrospirae bacterium]|uniref:DNA-methyltransferase n=1 Tax=Candidatus Magnetobacterium casense TaxID=1455061 RepID=UPI0006980ECB|nr:site-specific DNA-methyltransferase [Candidatus Magnetobacterium casensis]MBF0338588.1 site-specific DNA-methyltransferase [Nitrospirota bacterium]